MLLAALALGVTAMIFAHRDRTPGIVSASTPGPVGPPSQAGVLFDDFNNRDYWWGDCCGGPDLFPLDRTYVTSGATLEQGESAPCAPIGATIWIEYTADRSGTLHLDANGSDFDAVLAVYTWDLSGPVIPSPPGADLQSLACNDATPGADANLALEITRYTRYLIQVGGRDGASGNARVRATCDCAPPNDNFQEFSQDLYVNAYQPETNRTVSTVHATTEPGEPQPCGPIGATVWYILSTDTPSEVSIDTAGSDYDTVIAVYRLPENFQMWPPAFSDLELVACDAGPGAAVDIETDMYRSYFVQAGGVNGASGRLSLTARCQPACPPYNDSSVNAEWWEPPVELGPVTTRGATVEDGEPRPCGDIGATVWYRITARGETTLVIDSAGSDFATVLSVYQNGADSIGESPPGSLDLLDCEASSSATPARIEIRVDANIPYWLQAGGRGGAQGNLKLSVSCVPLPCPPPNDTVVNPHWFDRPYGEPYEQIVDVRGATVEEGEPLDCGGMSHTTWWTVDMYPGRPPIPFVFDTRNTPFATAITVYEARLELEYGPEGLPIVDFGDLNEVGCAPGIDGPARIAFTATPGDPPAGRRYYVQVGARGDTSGDLHVTISCDGPCPPENDYMSSGWYAPVGYEQATDTRAATVEPNEPLPCGNIGKTVWYHLGGAAPGDYRISTANSDFPTVIAVYRITSVSPPGGATDVVACLADNELTFEVEAGVGYVIQIGGLDGRGGNLSTRFDCVAGCELTSPPGGAIPQSGGGGVVGPDTGSGGYLPGARPD
jgi:hypothetical protein